MNVLKTSVGYPILGSADDYPYSNCSATCNSSSVGANLVVHISIGIDSQYVNELLEANTAVKVVDISCGRTIYRRTTTTTDNDIELAVAFADVAGVVEVEVYVVITSDGVTLNSPEFHPDYSDGVFIVDRGDVIAYCGTFDIPIDQNVGSVHSGNSIISIQPISGSKQRPRVELNSDRILVFLPRHSIDQLKQLPKNASHPFQTVILASIAQFGVMAALSVFVASDRSSYEGRAWFNVLENKLLEERFLDSDGCLDITELAEATSFVINDALTILPDSLLKVYRDEEE